MSSSRSVIVVASDQTRPATQVQQRRGLSPASSRGRNVVGSGGISTGGKAYLPTLLTSLFGHRAQKAAPSKGAAQSDCDYQLVAESEGLLSAFDEYRDCSGGEEEEDADLEDLKLQRVADTVIDMKLLSSSTVSEVPFSLLRSTNCKEMFFLVKVECEK